MNNQNKKGLLIFGSLVVMGGIGYYLYSQSRKKAKPQGSSTPEGSKETAPEKTDTAAPAAPATKAQPAKKVSTGPTSPMGIEKVKQFQDWMDGAHPNWVSGKNLNRGSGYGNFGPSTKAAWEKYGPEYLKVLEGKQKAASVQAIRDKFPIGKPVMAAIKFRGFGLVFRKGHWLSTDTTGRELPSREFLATADVGKVADYDGDNIVIKLDTPIFDTSGMVPTPYNFMRVKPSWIK